ncbi:zinc finger protein OZF [Biomphalaria glabrata]|nr:zinc finger protein OZF [Biomphalaria glabrata]
MDVLKQDFTTELKNMKTENIEWSLDSQMTENSYMSQTSRLFLEEQTQNRNGNQEMTLNQDILARNTPNKDVHTGNLQDEEQNDSIENKTYQLKHERNHSGKKPFQCQICQRGFTDFSILKRHEIIHSSEKPFKCQICPKKFARFSSLKRHEMIHSGKQPLIVKFVKKN